MFINDSKVYYKTDFLKPEELEILDAAIREKEGEILSEGVVGGYNTFEFKNSRLIKRLSSRVYTLISDVYGPDSLSVMYPRDEIQFLRENCAMDDHDDAEGQNVAHAAVIYLTDTKDYDGGELRYPKLGFEIKPERGSIAIHPREPEYTHGVNLVTRGIRYVLVMFTS